MVPPVIATALAFCVLIVPNPLMSVFGIVAAVVNADVPEAFRYPAVNVVAPVPP
jgi:hypothetical protein